LMIEMPMIRLSTPVSSTHICNVIFSLNAVVILNQIYESVLAKHMKVMSPKFKWKANLIPYILNAFYMTEHSTQTSYWPIHPYFILETMNWAMMKFCFGNLH
jgi:hypothetical protein